MKEFSFFKLSSPVKLGEIAKHTGCILNNGGESEITISSIGPIENTPPNSLSFLDNAKYVDALENTNVRAVICSKKYIDKVPDGIAVLR